MEKKRISIVLPVYFNEMNIADTVASLMLLPPQRSDLDFEFLFVDDGSGDSSYVLLQTFQKRYPEHIRLVKLTRNFGSMAAIQAGFSQCTGDYAGFIAADLQDPPELFLEMLKHLEQGSKVCMATRSDRGDPFVQKTLANTFYFLLRKFALKGYPAGGFDFLLVKRDVVDSINRIGEKNANFLTFRIHKLDSGLECTLTSKRAPWPGFDSIVSSPEMKRTRSRITTGPLRASSISS